MHATVAGLVILRPFGESMGAFAAEPCCVSFCLWYMIRLCLFLIRLGSCTLLLQPSNAATQPPDALPATASSEPTAPLAIPSTIAKPTIAQPPSTPQPAAALSIPSPVPFTASAAPALSSVLRPQEQRVLDWPLTAPAAPPRPSPTYRSPPLPLEPRGPPPGQLLLQPVLRAEQRLRLDVCQHPGHPRHHRCDGWWRRGAELHLHRV